MAVEILLGGYFSDAHYNSKTRDIYLGKNPNYTFERIIAILKHESLHFTLHKMVSKDASVRLDWLTNFFGDDLEEERIDALQYWYKGERL